MIYLRAKNSCNDYVFWAVFNHPTWEQDPKPNEGKIRVKGIPSNTIPLRFRGNDSACTLLNTTNMGPFVFMPILLNSHSQ